MMTINVEDMYVFQQLDMNVKEHRRTENYKVVTDTQHTDV